MCIKGRPSDKSSEAPGGARSNSFLYIIPADRNNSVYTFSYSHKQTIHTIISRAVLISPCMHRRPFCFLQCDDDVVSVD